MSQTIDAPINCPSCSQSMQSLELDRREIGKLQVDLCYPCCVIWFDHNESAQLAPSAVIELFRQINAQKEAARQPLSRAMACPRCAQPLALTHDVCKSGPLSYYRCARDGGRLTPFFQFLREKQFVRSLTPMEINRVRADIKQVQCSNCGAPVDLQHSASCQYCGSPISMLDADAVKEAMQMWSQAAARAGGPQSERSGNAASYLADNAVRPWNASPEFLSLSSFGTIEAGSDLVQLCIGALGDIFGSH
jgi:hypothetical protein